MISKMKLQNWILTLIGFIMLVSICVLVNRLESRKPEIEIRKVLMASMSIMKKVN